MLSLSATQMLPKGLWMALRKGGDPMKKDRSVPLS